ncbi:MAG TPA: glycosyltransferase family 87 protein [Gaiellaceae bacterium]
MTSGAEPFAGGRLRPVAVAASVLFVVGCAVAYGGLLSHAYPGDAGTYAEYARELVRDHRIPYRDFYIEYPPGAVPVFLAPALVWDAHYILVHKLLMTACGVGFVVCAAWILRRLGLSYLRLAPVVLAPPLMGPVFLNRYDPVAALLGSLALVALLRGRERESGATLGAATAIKLYAAVFVPVAARRVRDRVGSAVAYVVGAAVFVLPFFLLAPGGVGWSLWTQLRRHLQIESLGASILLVWSKLGIHHVNWVAGSPGSVDVDGFLADAIGMLTSLVAVALVLLVAWTYWRGPDDDARLVTAWAASITAFTVFSKVLSPQYMTWLAPLVPLAAGRKGAYAACTFLAALVLTQPEYIVDKHGLQAQNWAVWALAARNGFLVATFVFLYLQLRGEPGQATPEAGSHRA